MPTMSLYLKDETLNRIDAEVARAAAADKAAGLAGRAVTTRSSYIEGLLVRALDDKSPLSRETIEYHVISLAEEFGAQQVSLFGSYARDEATATSDVDILLDKGEIRGMQVLDFQEKLAQRLGRKVDVVTTAGASKRFLDKIKQDEVLLYAANRAR